ncbi:MULTISPECIES: hypothetical protein [Bacillus]|uniref:hypothetical protein n=1 Tax=Bacillus TaxID=1386 RepID=UPI001BB3ABA1|nr:MULTISPECIES: hypothetical protein [Bacillus]
MNNPSYSFQEYLIAVIILLLPSFIIFACLFPKFLLLSILLFAILFSYYGITIRVLTNKLNLQSMTPIYRLLAFLLSLSSFFLFLGAIPYHKDTFLFLPVTNHMEEILYLTITYTIFVFLFFLFEVIFYLYKHIKKPENITNKLDWIGFAIRLFAALFITLILPDIVFGILYNFTFSFYDNTLFEGDIWEFIYFSFLIHFALPINSDNLQNYVKLLNEHTLARVLQMIHITTCKFLDLTFLAILIQYFLGFINLFTIKNNKDS